MQKLGIEKHVHSLVAHLSELVKHLTEAGESRDDVKILDQYYIPTRHANAFAAGPAKDKYTEKQAYDAVERATGIIEWVTKDVL